MSVSQFYFGEVNDPQHHMILKGYIHEINRFRFNWHPQLELMLVTSGTLEAYVEGSAWLMEEDDVLLINSNRGHATLLKEPGTQAMVLHLDPLIFEEFFRDNKNFMISCRSDRNIRNQPEFVRIRRLMAGIMGGLLQSDDTGVYRVRGYTSLLAAELIESFPQQEVSDKCLADNKRQDKIMKQIFKYSEKNYSKKITMTDLSELTGYNRTYLSTLFKERIGIGYYEYLTRIRLRHGIHELNKTTKTILDIALDTGFADAKSFTTAFRKYFSKTPNEYRIDIRNEKSPVIDELVRQFIPLGDPVADKKLREYACETPEHIVSGKSLQLEEQAEKLRVLKETTDAYYQNLIKILDQ